MQSIKKILWSVMAALMVAVGLQSCLDEPLLRDEEIGEGESVVSLELTALETMDANLGRSRAAGDAVETVNDLFVAFYRADGELAKDENGAPLTYYWTRGEMTITEPDRVDEGSKTETTTERAKVKGTIRVPYGRYHIYSVVNMGDLSKTHGEAIENEADLRKISFGWVADPERVGENNQMSGYFDTDITKTLDENVSLVTINKTVTELKSWVKRAVSKVTVDFDAKGLNENIYIYLQSVQVRDIASSCLLVDDNTPTDRKTLQDGEIYYYSDSKDYKDWPRLACGRGANTYGEEHHKEDSPASLFFYENKQGVDPQGQKHLYQNFEEKDNFLCGTYVEVVGYYENFSKDNPSYGKIKYRFMLGQNTTDDFNATRNTHYKLTLVFNNDANDPDWHIEFGYKPAPPQVVTHDVYISYLYDRFSTIPVKIYYDENVVGKVKDVKAEIVYNPWEYDANTKKGETYHRFSRMLDTWRGQLWDKEDKGFLSLKMSRDVTVQDDEVLLEKDVTSLFKPIEDPEYTVVEGDIDVYTRALNIQAKKSGTGEFIDMGYSGNNFYFGRTRTAQVKISASFTNSTIVKDTTINVIQVKRLINPKGIWRKAGNKEAFHVVLAEGETDPNTVQKFVKTVSEQGPWKAHIVAGADWVQIKDTESGVWGTEPVTGGTGSNIEFDYRPATTISETAEPRFGMIEVRYNDNTCVHNIMVIQGYGTVDMGTTTPDGKKVKWHMGNVMYAGGGGDVKTPLQEGSLFMYGSNVGIKAENALDTLKFGFEKVPGSQKFATYTKGGGTGSAAFTGMNSTRRFTTDFTGSASTRVSNYNDWNQMYEDKVTYQRFYGLLYGDNSTDVKYTPEDAFRYINEDDDKAIRCLFVYNKTLNKCLVFPLGTYGYGRRKYANTDKPGTMRYANRSEIMTDDLVKSIGWPTLYDIKNQKGALYWLDDIEWHYSPGQKKNEHFGVWDINYSTFGFGPYETNVWYTTGGGDPKVTGSKIGEVLNDKLPEKGYSDAAFVRLVDVGN